MLRRNKLTMAMLAIGVLLILVVVHFFNLLSEYEDRVEVWMSNYALGYANDLSPRRLLGRQEVDALSMFENWTVVGVSDTAIESNTGIVQGIELHHIGYGYGDVLTVTTEKGRFLWREDIEEASSAIVLDNSLAFELFGHIDCIGNNVYIEEVKFSVVGVVRADSSLGRKAHYRAYIPFMDESVTMDISHIGIIGYTGYRSGDIASFQLENHMKQLNFRGDISVFNIDGESTKASQKIRVNLFIAGFIFAWLIWRRYITYVQKNIAKLRKGIEEYYISELIKIYRSEILSLCISGIIMLSLTGLLYGILSFQLYIPPSYIPDDLFDYLEYKDIIIEKLIQTNKGYVYTPSSFLAVQHISRMLNIILAVIWIWGKIVIDIYSKIDRMGERA